MDYDENVLWRIPYAEVSVIGDAVRFENHNHENRTLNTIFIPRTEIPSLIKWLQGVPVVEGD